MKICSYNVAGLRALIKKEESVELKSFINNNDFDILCLQEIKCEEKQLKLPGYILEKYPHRYFNSNMGLTQKKGFSGVAMFSKSKPLVDHPVPEFDVEGRIKALEYHEFIVVCVYVPNSQNIESVRYNFRVNLFDKLFQKYITKLNSIKPTIVCGDFNVVSLPIDYHNFKRFQNKGPCLYDEERQNFHSYLELGFVDIYRELYPDKIGFTYWSNFCKECTPKNGWKLDYFLIDPTLKNRIVECHVKTEQLGSDHRPLYLSLI